MDVINNFCAIKQTKPELSYAPVQQNWGTAWSCTIRVPGCFIVTQNVGPSKEEAREQAVREFVAQLKAQGLTKGSMGKMAKGLGKGAMPSAAPSWSLAGAGGGANIITEAEHPNKYMKGKGKGKKGKDKDKGKKDGKVELIDNGLIGNVIEHLRTGRGSEALDAIHKRYGFASPGIMTVKQFADCASAVGIRSREEDVMKFFDGVHSMELIRFPDMPSASYFQRFARWAVREFLAEGISNVGRTQDQIPQLLERQGVCVQKLTAVTSPRGGMEIHLMADNQLPKGHGFVRSDWIMLTFPHTGQVRLPPPEADDWEEVKGSICLEAELVGFQPGGPGPQNGFGVKVVGNKPELLKFLLNRTCRVDRIANRVTFNRQMKSLHKICGEPDDLRWLSQILMAGEELYHGLSNAPSMCEVRPEGAAGFPAGTTLLDHVNTSQLEALTQATSRRLTLIQGPPGAGKTHTTVTLVRLLVSSGKCPVICTADSNVAVDNLVMGTSKAGLNVTRVGRADASHASLNDYNLYEKIKAEAGEVSGARGQYAEERKILKNSDVICCTAAGSAHPVFEGMRFNAVLFDEAGQCTELATLVPLMTLTPNGSVTLVGDHKQLPATVACLAADVEGLGNSLFERLASQGVKPILLNTQYRMHPAIAAYPSKTYYNDLLRTGVSGVKRKAPQGIHWPEPNVPVAFLPVEGREAKEGNSFTNSAEVTSIAELLRAVLAGGEVKGGDIGIITPYAAQVRYLRQHLGIPNRHELTGPSAAATLANCPDVASVDGFQGREKEVIFMSAVRANAQGKLGFTGDPRRLNVSFTRAKRGLVVVGNFDTLSKDKNGWQPWLLWAQQRGLIAGCEATDPEAAAALRRLHELPELELLHPGSTKAEPPPLLAHTMVVKEGVGAGLNLNPEDRGMRVLGVLPDPGQPGVMAGDLIVQIAGANLGPDAQSSVDTFGDNFRDGAEIVIERLPC